MKRRPEIIKQLEELAATGRETGNEEDAILIETGAHLAFGLIGALESIAGAIEELSDAVKQGGIDVAGSAPHE